MLVRLQKEFWFSKTMKLISVNKITFVQQVPESPFESPFVSPFVSHFESSFRL